MAIHKKPCPTCGRVLIYDDERRSIGHALPLCDQFRRVITEAQAAKHLRGMAIEQVDKDGKPTAGIS